MATPWKLYYDGGCNLCHTAKLRCESWAATAHQPLEVDILQSAEAIQKGYGDAMVIEADGKTYFATDAWMKMMTISPWYLRWVAWVGAFPLTAWIVRGIYGIVEKYRYRWFGTRSCPVPSSRK